MPYKDPCNPKNIDYKKAYYERTKENRYERVKHNITSYRERNPEKYALQSKLNYWNNREKMLSQSRDWYAKNGKEYQQEQTKNLSDYYIKKQLRKMGYSNDLITPQLIEIKRNILTIKRLINGTNLRSN